jgi:hypothetical protein
MADMMHTTETFADHAEAVLSSDGAPEAQVFATLAVAAAINRLAVATERMVDIHRNATEVAAQALNT